MILSVFVELGYVLQVIFERTLPENPRRRLPIVFGNSYRIISDVLNSVEDAERRIFFDDCLDVGVVKEGLDHVGFVAILSPSKHGPFRGFGTSEKTFDGITESPPDSTDNNQEKK